MKRIIQFAMIATWIAAIVACGENTAGPNDSKGGLQGPWRPRPAVQKITIPEGTRLRVALIDGVGTTKSAPGDEFMASIIETVTVGGKTVLDKGTKVRGRVTDVNQSGRVKGRASIGLVLSEIVRDGESVSISTQPFVAVAEATKKRDAAIVGGGAGVGAAIGAIAGGKKGAAVGAAIGGGAGTGTVLATKGKDINYPPETKLTFTLVAPVEI